MATRRRAVAPAEAHRVAVEQTEQLGSRALRASIGSLVVLAWWSVLAGGATWVVGGLAAVPLGLLGLGVAGICLVGRPSLPMARTWLAGLGWLTLATVFAGGSLVSFLGGAPGGADLAGWLLVVGSLAVGFEAGRSELDARWLRVLVVTTLAGVVVSMAQAVNDGAWAVMASTVRVVLDGPVIGRGVGAAMSGRLFLDVAVAGGVLVTVGIVASTAFLAHRLWEAGEDRFGRGAFAALLLWASSSVLVPHDGSLTALVLILVGATLGTAAETARRIRQAEGGPRSRPSMDLVDRWALATISLLLGWVLSALLAP